MKIDIIGLLEQKLSGLIIFINGNVNWSQDHVISTRAARRDYSADISFCALMP